MKDTWVTAGAVEDFEIGKGVVVKAAGRQAAVFRLAETAATQQTGSDGPDYPVPPLLADGS